MTQVVIGVTLSVGAPTVLHYRLCWRDFQCESDPSMHPHVIVFNRLRVDHSNCLFLMVSIFVCFYLSVI